MAEPSESAESYASFWDAIPLDSDNSPAPITDKMALDDAYADFLARTEEGGSSWLSVEETDVG